MRTTVTPKINTTKFYMLISEEYGGYKKLKSPSYSNISDALNAAEKRVREEAIIGCYVFEAVKVVRRTTPATEVLDTTEPTDPNSELHSSDLLDD